MSILIILPISTIINESDPCLEKINNRKQQYIDGLKKFFELQYANVILIDNTTECISNDICNVVPKNVNIIGCIRNNFGAINKGSGLIEVWNYLSSYIVRYEYIIHFEPRQLLINHDVIDMIIKNPANYFKTYINHFYTGLFCIKSTALLEFITQYTAAHLAYNKISIEYALYDFMKDKQVNLLPQLNLLRFDHAANTIERH
jgi:hypothetical protein